MSCDDHNDGPNYYKLIDSSSFLPGKSHELSTVSDTLDHIRRECASIRDDLRADIAKMGQEFPAVSQELAFSQIVWDCIPLMMVELLSMRIVKATPAAHEMFGYHLWDLIGKEINDLIPLEYRARHDQHVADYKVDPHDRQMGHQAGINLKGIRLDQSIIDLEIGLYASRSDPQYVFLTLQKT